MTNSVPARPIEPCPRPSRCPVAVAEFQTWCTDDPDSLPVASLTEGEPWVRVYWSDDGHADPNPGFGSTRFAPFPGHGPAADIMIPTMYLARTLRSALLETVFHTADPSGGISATGAPKLPAVVTGNDLLGRLHAHLALPRSMRLLDLRNNALSSLGLRRDQLASSSAMHYPCTRRVAEAVCNATASTGAFDGIIWHSRQSEIAATYSTTPAAARSAGASVPAAGGSPDEEVVALFCHRVPSGRRAWKLVEAPDSSGSLFEGRGERTVLELAADLGIVFDPNIDGN